MLRETAIRNKSDGNDALSSESRIKGTNNLPENELVARAKVDSDAFGELYERTYGRILNYVYRRTLNQGYGVSPWKLSQNLSCSVILSEFCHSERSEESLLDSVD